MKKLLLGLFLASFGSSFLVGSFNRLESIDDLEDKELLDKSSLNQTSFKNVTWPEAQTKCKNYCVRHFGGYSLGSSVYKNPPADDEVVNIVYCQCGHVDGD